MKTYLSEIFSSIQGEGPYVGERHLFVRFSGCHRKCVFCDTNVERTESVVVEVEPGVFADKWVDLVADDPETPVSIIVNPYSRTEEWMAVLAELLPDEGDALRRERFE